MSHYNPYSDYDDYNPARQGANPDYTIHGQSQAQPSAAYNQPQSASWERGNTGYPPSPPADPFDPPHTVNPQPSYSSFANTSAGYHPVTAQNIAPSHDDMPQYNNYSQSGPIWTDNTPIKPNSGRRKYLIIGGVVAVIAIAAAVGIAIAVTHKKSSSSSASLSGSTSHGSDNPSNTAGWVMSQNSIVKYNPKDLSQFQTDPRLIKSFYGIAYTPIGAILPSCGATFDGILEDVYLMSQLTKRVRLYGNRLQTKVDLSVYIGIFIDTDDTTFERQKTATQDILTTYGTDHVLGLTVGNEFILGNLTALKSQDPTSPAGIAAADFLITKITEVRTMLSSLSLTKTIPVGNGDAGAYTNVQLLSAVDYFMSNIHPWFGGLPVDQAAGWTWQFLQDNNANLVAQTTNHPNLIIAEVGWPGNSSSVADSTDGPSKADIPTLQIFLDDWVCAANKNGTQYFWFENMDQPWKDALYGGVEGWWGLFDSTKHLKNLTIPNCLAS